MGKFNDLTGKRFSRLKVLRRIGIDGGFATWLCRCSCGNEKVIKSSNLKSGTKSCGCLYRERIHGLKGKKIRNWKFIERVENIGRYRAWRVRCDCGREVVTRAHNILYGRWLSCPCLVIKRLEKKYLGKKLGKLKVVRHIRGRGSLSVWECKCDCGKVTQKTARYLDSSRNLGSMVSCDGQKHSLKNIESEFIGKRFGRLVVQSYAGVRAWGQDDKRRWRKWKCLCDCGKIKISTTWMLKSGNCKSCGCILKDTPGALKHGLSGSRMYYAWASAKVGARIRHIPMCKEWKSSVENFIKDMGEKPQGRYRLAFVNRSRGYVPDNCYWKPCKPLTNTSYNRSESCTIE